MEPITSIALGVVGSLIASALIYGGYRLAKLIRNLKRILLGSSIIIVGPGNAGKTALTRILLTGEYPKKDDGIPRTTAVDEHKAYRISGGKKLNADIVHLSDFGGQMGTGAPANAPEEKTTNGIILCIQADKIGRNNKNFDIVSWIDEYFKELEPVLKKRECREKLYSFIIVVTKCDQAKESDIEKLRTDIDKSISKHLKSAMGDNVDSIEIFEGSLIQPNGPDFVANILEKLITRLKMKQPIIR